ncbi:MAG: CYTH domain-containing protein, partial [Pseudomonas sp.]|nr:CYTH domain-containing protein [Pseudomonas sp.]
KLDDSCWPAQLADLDKKTIKPLFTTDFTREYAEIAWGRGKAKVVIEAALDQGFVIAGKRKEAICELELELREGEPAALLELAAELTTSVALMPCDISKAERGYRLLEPERFELDLSVADLEADMALDDAYAALAWQLLGNSQRLAEQYRHSGHWRSLQDWVQNLIELRAITASLGQAAPRAATRDLRARLDALLEDWRPLVQAGNDDEDIRRAAPEQFAEELDDPRWGQFSLETSRWLLSRAWTAERKGRGERQGKALLASWLAHLIAEEGRALKLSLYTQRPEDLAEQLPRIEQLMAWLHHARHVLDAPQMDRLYGDMKKLHELAEQPISDEVLEARIEQARAVDQSRGWKHLLKA